MTNLEWIAQGNTGCTFATLFARDPAKVGWAHLTNDHYERNHLSHHKDSLIVSIEFPSTYNAKKVRDWCRRYRWFYEEKIDDECIGLRYDPTIGNNNEKIKTSWVQYFGPDSHVVTRQAPNPMIMYTRKLNPLGYYKQVGFTGILHLAHAFSKHLTDKMVNTLWFRSYEQVAKKIGHKPTIKEAAKTTWLKKDVL